MITTYNHADHLIQNSDYNAWKCDTFHMLILLWYTNGKIVDDSVNLPDTFHDSLCATWCGIYKHISEPPEK